VNHLLSAMLSGKRPLSDSLESMTFRGAPKADGPDGASDRGRFCHCFRRPGHRFVRAPHSRSCSPVTCARVRRMLRIVALPGVAAQGLKTRPNLVSLKTRIAQEQDALACGRRWH
jgi:hypothetical protein